MSPLNYYRLICVFWKKFLDYFRRRRRRHTAYDNQRDERHDYRRQSRHYPVRLSERIPYARRSEAADHRRSSAGGVRALPCDADHSQHGHRRSHQSYGLRLNKLDCVVNEENQHNAAYSYDYRRDARNLELFLIADVILELNVNVVAERRCRKQKQRVRGRYDGRDDSREQHAADYRVQLLRDERNEHLVLVFQSPASEAYRKDR